jgi:hypothetical protein
MKPIVSSDSTSLIAPQTTEQCSERVIEALVTQDGQTGNPLVHNKNYELSGINYRVKSTTKIVFN